MKNTILVPMDFSKVAACAVRHAVNTARTTEGEIALLHVVSKPKEVDEAQKKVDALAKATQDEHGITTKGIVSTGNIFDDIGDTAAELKAKLIIMGTHGMKGMQRITGSYALKVITNSRVPFIVVQEKNPETDGYKDIVLPLDLSKETKQKLRLAIETAKYFKSKIHVIVPDEADQFFRNQLKRNIAFTKKHLMENNISFSTNIAEEGNFAKSVIHLATKINADLISIMNLKRDSLVNLFGGGYEQRLITNESQIPVMCVNPKETSRGRGGGLFS